MSWTRNYNVTKFQLNARQMQTEFNDVLEFVEQYYYRNWTTYAVTPDLQDNPECKHNIFVDNQEKISKWIDALITDAGR